MLEFIRFVAERPEGEKSAINLTLRTDGGKDPMLAFISWNNCSFEHALEMICAAANWHWWIEDTCIAVGPRSLYEKRKDEIKAERKIRALSH